MITERKPINIEREVVPGKINAPFSVKLAIFYDIIMFLRFGIVLMRSKILDLKIIFSSVLIDNGSKCFTLCI